jgi:hypothetical protein
MMTIHVILGISVIINLLLGWYITRLLRKFLYISENLSDLFLILRSFRIFIKSMYGMDSYHGEPMIQELIERIKQIIEEIENFREIFVYTLDDELEEELDAADEETTQS